MLVTTLVRSIYKKSLITVLKLQVAIKQGDDIPENCVRLLYVHVFLGGGFESENTLS